MFVALGGGWGRRARTLRNLSSTHAEFEMNVLPGVRTVAAKRTLARKLRAVETMFQFLHITATTYTNMPS